MANGETLHDVKVTDRQFARVRRKSQRQLFLCLRAVALVANMVAIDSSTHPVVSRTPA